MADWMAQNAGGLLQAIGTVAALSFAGGAFILDVRARRISNLIRLTEQHRELWERMYFDPQLSRILERTADPVSKPITPQEQLFVIFIILHLNSSYYAMKTIFLRQPEGLRKDVKLFFSLPIPSTVWERVRNLQDRRFVQFVEESIEHSDSN